MQNWTADFPVEFRRRAGYDLRPYLPAMLGRIVASRALSERFLFDLRRVQADLMAENYYGHMNELCRQHGLKLYVEGYGQGVFDELQVSGLPDVPMTEFWERTPWTPNRTVKMVSSAAHVYGKPIVAAEAFTGEEETARWEEYPYSLKILGDEMFAQGVNQLVFHRYAHQPHPTAVPGMTMGPWGFFMDRTNTWFEDSSAWLTYLARCQYLLRQGTYVADLLYFTGERPPGADNFEIPAAPAGFSYDLINADALLTRAHAVNGRILLANGATYQALVLPPDLQGATPELMRKLRDLASAGAQIVGPKPTFSPTLRRYPESETEVKRIADELKISPTLQLPSEPDFQYEGRNHDAAISWTHRKLPGGELYFIANRQRRPESLTCTFRVSNLAPEFWNAETGEIRKAAVYSPGRNTVQVPIHLGPAESTFIIFRERANAPIQSFTWGGAIPVTGTLGSNPPPVSGNFTISVWAKPDIDLRLMPKESTTGHVDETGKFYLFPAAECDKIYGPGHACAALAVGRNGAYVLERSSDASPAVLVANIHISGWTHFALVYRDNHPRLYVNGKFIREGLATGAIVHPGIGLSNRPPDPETTYHFNSLDSLLRASGRPPEPSNGLAYYFEGNMTEPEVTPRALSDSEIAARAARPLPTPIDPNPWAELWRDASTNRIEALIWLSGHYTILGHTRFDATVPDPIAIAGPWRVAFQSNRGAPSAIDLPALESLHKNSDPGVRYFSGTATYSRDIDIPATYFATNKRIYLDLGRVEVLARVRLNSRDLGVVWKEPYRLDITAAAHPGANRLEVAVTNLWPNRLIGDEQLPPENQYSTGPEHGILALPDWYRNLAPKPASPRLTFATWQFFHANDPLYESGLLGPVRILNPSRMGLPARPAREAR